MEFTEIIHVPKFLWGIPAENSLFKPGYIEGKKIYRAETSTDPRLWSKMLENISISNHMEIPLVLITGCNCSSHWAWRIFLHCISVSNTTLHLPLPLHRKPACWAIFLSAFEVKWKIFNAGDRAGWRSRKEFSAEWNQSLLPVGKCMWSLVARLNKIFF